MNSKYNSFTISINDNNRRIDSVIRKFLPNQPLQKIFKYLRNGDIRVNGKKVKQNYRLQLDDILEIYSPLINKNEKKSKNIRNIKSERVIYQNSHLLFYNKEQGELVHGEKDSLDMRIREYLKGKIEESLSFKPGPLHRLDRNTSGIITFSVSLEGARTFTQMLKDNHIRKVYLTVVDGEFNKKEIWSDSISRDEKKKKSYISSEGKKAVTTFIPLKSKSGKTVALMDIEGGRTHQIRVQASYHNKPLTGDNKYNKNKRNELYFLSAISLTFNRKSDILERDGIYISPKSIDNKILRDLFSDKELEELEVLIKKELNIK